MAKSYDIPRKSEMAERVIAAFEEEFGVETLDDDQFSLAMLAVDEAWEYLREFEIEGNEEEPEVTDDF